MIEQTFNEINILPEIITICVCLSVCNNLAWYGTQHTMYTHHITF